MSSYDFFFDVNLDNSGSNTILSSSDISNNTNYLDNLEESLVNILNSYMNTGIQDNSLNSTQSTPSTQSTQTRDNSGSRLSQFLQSSRNRYYRRLPLRQNYIYEGSNLDNEYMSFINNLFGTSSSYRLNNILNQSLNYTDQKKYKNVISEEGKDNIKFEEYKKSEYPDQICCPMTLNDFNDGDEVAVLPCGHIFEKNAILKWLEKEDNRCPVCRKELPSKEIKIQETDSTQNNEDDDNNNDNNEDDDDNNDDDYLDSEDDEEGVPNLVETFDNETTTPLIQSPPPLPRIQTSRLTSTQIINSIINREMRMRDEEDLQAAIMASLLDSNNN